MCSFLAPSSSSSSSLLLLSWLFWVWLWVERRWRGCEEKGSSDGVGEGGFRFEGWEESGDRLGSKLLVLSLSFSISFPFPLSGFLFFRTFSLPLPPAGVLVDFLFPVEPFGRPLPAPVLVWGRGGLNGFGAIVQLERKRWGSYGWWVWGELRGLGREGKLRVFRDAVLKPDARF